MALHMVIMARCFGCVAAGGEGSANEDHVLSVHVGVGGGAGVSTLLSTTLAYVPLKGCLEILEQDLISPQFFLSRQLSFLFQCRARLIRLRCRCGPNPICPHR